MYQGAASLTVMAKSSWRSHVFFFFLVTVYVIVIVIFKIQWRPLVTDAKISVIIIGIYRYKSSVLNDTMVLRNINNGNPLHHNDDLFRHQIIILLEVVNDSAP